MNTSRTNKTKFLFLAAWALVEVAYLSSATVTPAAAALTGPAEIYAANCARCHGVDGKANTGKGKRAGATDLTSDWNTDEARGLKIITNGKGEMPSFKSKLSRDEIRSVFGYVLKFHK